MLFSVGVAFYAGAVDSNTSESPYFESILSCCAVVAEDCEDLIEPFGPGDTINGGWGPSACAQGFGCGSHGCPGRCGCGCGSIGAPICRICRRTSNCRFGCHAGDFCIC